MVCSTHTKQNCIGQRLITAHKEVILLNQHKVEVNSIQSKLKRLSETYIELYKQTNDHQNND